VILSEGYSCSGITEYICDDRVHTIGGVSREQKMGEMMGELKILSMKQSPRFEYIPEGLGKFFPVLEVFDCTDCGITSVSSGDLVQFPHLKVLNLYRNKISSLPGDLFENTPEILSFDFGRNKISRVGPTFFDHLKNLKSFSFEETKCMPGSEHLPFEEKKKQVIDHCISKKNSRSLDHDLEVLDATPLDPSIEKVCKEINIMEDEINIKE
jgi:hypothetical protein